MLDNLLDHYENLRGWKKSVLTPLRLHVKQERMKKLKRAQERKKNKKIIKKGQQKIKIKT